MTVNTDVQALIDKAVNEAEAATIPYSSWHDRVVTGWYASRHIDPYTQTAWGRFLAAAQNARGLLNTPPPTPIKVAITGTLQVGQTLKATVA